MVRISPLFLSIMNLHHLIKPCQILKWYWTDTKRLKINWQQNRCASKCKENNFYHLLKKSFKLDSMNYLIIRNFIHCFWKHSKKVQKKNFGKISRRIKFKSENKKKVNTWMKIREKKSSSISTIIWIQNC